MCGPPCVKQKGKKEGREYRKDFLVYSSTTVFVVIFGYHTFGRNSFHVISGCRVGWMEMCGR